MLDNTTGMRPPIGYPLICLINLLLREKKESSASLISNFLKVDCLQNGFIPFHQNVYKKYILLYLKLVR